jgi:putative oxygen-independent coproporphyrinogen III oxidase
VAFLADQLSDTGGMPSTPPTGEPAPTSGELPPSALDELGGRPFGVYVHVPFCTRRCGYCDFNTYTDLGGMQASYADLVVREIGLARRVLGDVDLPVETVFVGGGTPTLLPAGDLGHILAAVDDCFGLADGAEVTTEANPDSVDAAYLAELRTRGFTRVSFGMQSAVPHVLATLDRTHAPGRPEQCVAWARAAGFDQISLDLIYGTPGESAADWQCSLDAAVSAGPDHVSAYSLIVEPGTRLAARVARGELPAPDDDDLADKYLQADETLTAAGLSWYEVSNWARPGGECRHNLAYWRSADWWGAGPGAHSHVGGVRWWNVRHPTAYAAALLGGRSPAQAREVLDQDDRHTERVLLETRLAEGLETAMLTAAERAVVPGKVRAGLVTERGDRLVLTRRGRLLADAVVRDLLVTSDGSAGNSQ